MWVEKEFFNGLVSVNFMKILKGLKMKHWFNL